MTFAQKSMFYATEKGEEREEPPSLSPHQNSLKSSRPNKQVSNNYSSFDFREKNL